ncbi:DMT family transporter [Skermanella mucosa]|uniref:DMT family transporter n=1 Tax=Skermanella mucosa TaxID=1789672 RepID=UPI001E497F1A|nr:DMT family transporter [Skermanella mucosa]UEM20321.1 DMT family transporter [Skermanella mucosa]
MSDPGSTRPALSSPGSPSGTAGIGTSATVSARSAYLLLATVILLWGINWPVMKLGLADIPPMTFAVIRMVLGALCMFGVVAVRGGIRLPDRHDLPIVLSVGLLQMGAFLALVTVALQFVPAGRSSILAYTTALWVVPGAAIFLGERLGGRRLIGFLLGMAGVAVMFNPAAFDWTDRDVLIGNGLLMLAALAWAAQIIQVRGHTWHASPLQLAPWQFTVAAVALLPFAIFLDAGKSIDWTAQLAAVLFYNAPIATAFCFWAVVTVNRALPAITTSLGTLGVPVAGVFASAVMLGEPVTLTNLTGLVLILGGLTWLALADRRPSRAP